MNQLITILSSSVVAALITAVFAYIQNRRTNSINYITGERKLWRDKIKTLAEDISKCKYHGTKDKDISVCLVRLQMNINTYGKVKKNDYIHDSHIWDIIDRIQKADSEEAFEADKELLLYYISFMLKEDWERSKREIRGDFCKMGYIIIYILLSAIWAWFYFGILNLQDIALFLIVEVLLLFPFLSVFYLFNDSADMVVDKKIITVKKRIKNKKHISVNGIGVCILLVIYMLIFCGIGYCVIPKQFINNFEYSYDNDVLRICTHLNNSRFNGLEGILEGCFDEDEKIVFVDSFEENYKLYRLPKEINNKIFINVKAQIAIFDMLGMLFLLYTIISVGAAIWLSINLYSEKTRLPDAIHKITYLSMDNYIKDLFEANRVLTKIRQMDDKTLQSWEFELLLGFGYSLLFNIKKYINSKLADFEKTASCLEECEKYIELKGKQMVINNCIKIINKMSGRHKSKKKKELLNELEHQLSTTNICNDNAT